ncbi:MAG: ankyrin repeat-containing domain protein [Benniella sp.]|nr:MAG: ankyrin repeat-containing domain protein [Benniella sp.]
MTPSTGCVDHDQPGHVCNHTPSSVSESLDELDFARSIHAACINNNIARVQAILSKDSSRRGVSPATSLDSAGYTALHYASRAGNKEICTLLLNAGAEVDAKTPELGTTPLMRAVHQNHLVVARLLVSYGASIDETNSDQENVFHILATAAKNAAAKGDSGQNDNKESHVELARWLRNKASSQQEGKLDRMLTARDIHGRIPVECLGEDRAQEFSDIVAMLSSS